MGKEWEIKDVREMEYFLGMQVQQDLTLETITMAVLGACYQPL